MPLTVKGEQMLRLFHNKYGEAKGNVVFYAYMNKFPKKTKSWHQR